MAANPLRNIPSVNELLESPPLQTLVQRVNRSVVVSGVRDFLDGLRAEVQSAAAEMKVPHPKDLAERIAQWIVKDQRPSLQPRHRRGSSPRREAQTERECQDAA